MASTNYDPNLILIRPGRTDFDDQGRIIGTLDIPLNSDGVSEIDVIGKKLLDEDVQIIYHSPCQAAEQTADALAEILDVKSKSDERLRNLDHGLWQGMQIEEVKQHQPKVYRRWQEQPETVCPPEGETLALVTQRVEYVCNRLRKKHKHGSVVIVAPEPYASILAAHLRQQEVGDLWHSESNCEAWECIAITPPDKLVSVGENE